MKARNILKSALCLTLLTSAGLAQSSGGDFRITRFVVSGGGGSSSGNPSSGGPFQIDGTVNEPSAANTILGQPFALDGGFWNIFDDLTIPPAPVVLIAGISLTNESCPPANGLIDPGETATVNFILVNSGNAGTANLVATLQASANVLAPSGSQTYGALTPGTSAGRDFTFTANGNCGQVISLSLQLQDGTASLGTVNINATLGCNSSCAGAPRISATPVLSCSNGSVVATFTISNSGTATANHVILSTVRLGTAVGTPLPQPEIVSLAPGASEVRAVTFGPDAPLGSTFLQFGGTYNGGTFNANRRVTAPSCDTAVFKRDSLPQLDSEQQIRLEAHRN
jgi:hypothetical protein